MRGLVGYWFEFPWVFQRILKNNNFFISFPPWGFGRRSEAQLIENPRNFTVLTRKDGKLLGSLNTS